MTSVKTEVPAEIAPVRAPRAVAVAWLPVLVVAAGLVALLIAFANQYGYLPDELYFRLLGKHGPAWGYVDQPPLLPMLVRTAMAVFGDSVWAIRVPAMLCAAALTVLGAMIAAELGGSRRGQTLTAFAVASSALSLNIGHYIVTNSLDTVAWAAVLVCVLRALLREQGKWWCWAGLVLGLALYAKYIVLLLIAALLVGLLLAGPRKVFADRWLYLGAGLALVLAAPNLIYQATHDFPQLHMAQALGATDGAVYRAMFFTNLVLLLGPILFVLCLIGLVRLFRVPEWKPLRALGIGYVLATAATYLVDGGRPDYTAGLLVMLLAAGCVAADRWAGRGRLRLALLVILLVLGFPLQVMLSLPVIPLSDFHKFQRSGRSLQDVGWQQLAAQTEAAYRALPEADRSGAVLLTQNFAEAGALDRYGHGLPPVYSGHNELYEWGPPPESARVVIAIGEDKARLAAGFGSCRTVGTVDNGLGIDNPEQGRPITVCRDRERPWAQLWPGYRHLSAYP
ncbi:ArnT family glycosyltransferase [Sciscionella sediminilitoris]|uniref:ArnT family glycosyltransferase n=1 Tax=Sciscionella sediminilitoris TaxID=1445613 RepID=UPI0007C7125F|nr:glycosyltransferase family 39 protein [Sciscionella sp. SE31]